MPNPLETNPLRQAILGVVEPVLDSRAHGCPAIITEIYEDKLLADVIANLGGNKVAYKMVSFGTNLAVKDSYDKGETVWLNFKDGNKQDPIIVSKYQPNRSWKDSATTEANYNRMTPLIYIEE